MTTWTLDNHTVQTPEGRRTVLCNLGLRIVAAVLQILATAAVVQALPPTIVGVYFKGFVIAYALASLLRGKYELYVTQYFLSNLDAGLPARTLVRGLGIRVLIRGTIACALLLVITADLDVMEPHLRPYLETYLPFVLAVPFTTLALFLASVLRALNRTLSSTLVATYSVNVMIIAAASSSSGSHESALVLLSWAFFVGTGLSAGVGVLITRHILRTSPSDVAARNDAAMWGQIYEAAAENAVSGLALTCLQWGPLCLLAVLGAEWEFAQFAVVTRTAQVIDILIPAAMLVPHAIYLHSRFAINRHAPHSRLAIDLAVSMVTTSASVLAVALTTPWIIEQYGVDYAGLAVVFVLLFLTQWLNGAGRPAIRHLAAHWDLLRARRILTVSMVAAIAVSMLGIGSFGAIGAAMGVCAGALFMNGQAIQAAFSGLRGLAR
jgi:hypothetical protein